MFFHIVPTLSIGRTRLLGNYCWLRAWWIPRIWLGVAGMRATVREIHQEVPFHGQPIPRLEFSDQSWLRLGMRFKVIVDPGGKRSKAALILRIEFLIVSLAVLGDFKHAVQQITSQLGFPMDFRVAPQRADAIVFDLPKVIFRLRITHAKTHCREILAENMRHAPFIAMNRDLIGKGRGARGGME